MIRALCRTKVSSCPRRFREIRPWTFANVFNAPLWSPFRLFYTCFLTEMWKHVRPKYHKKKKIPNIWLKWNENKKRFKLGRWTSEHVFKISGSISPKWRGHLKLDSEGIWSENKFEPASTYKQVPRIWLWFVRRDNVRALGALPSARLALSIKQSNNGCCESIGIPMCAVQVCSDRAELIEFSCVGAHPHTSTPHHSHVFFYVLSRRFSTRHFIDFKIPGKVVWTQTA